jgi:hypothetical protein
LYQLNIQSQFTITYLFTYRIVIKRIGIIIPKQLQTIPVIAVFLPLCSLSLISFRATIPIIKPITPKINPTQKYKAIDRTPKTKEVTAFLFKTFLSNIPSFLNGKPLPKHSLYIILSHKDSDSFFN